MPCHCHPVPGTFLLPPDDLALPNLGSSWSPVLVAVTFSSMLVSPCPSTRMSFSFLLLPFSHDNGAVRSFTQPSIYPFTGARHGAKGRGYSENEKEAGIVLCLWSGQDGGGNRSGDRCKEKVTGSVRAVLGEKLGKGAGQVGSHRAET